MGIDISTPRAPQSGDRISIRLALIHNNNAQRNAVIRPKIGELAAQLALTYAVDTFSVAYQPALQPHSVSLAFKRDAQYHYLEYQWKKYRLLKTSALQATCTAVRSLAIKYLRNRNQVVERWRRSSAIEVTVTDKHIRAWDQFLETEADLLICLEDDAIFKSDSNAKIAQIIEQIAQFYRHENLYADLGGGCHLEDLLIEQLQQRKDNFITYYRKPVTNTACAYLLSRPLVNQFKSILIEQPTLRLIGIDWMMNKLLMELERRKENCMCFHTNPTVFKHGSTTGKFQAWER